MESVGEPLMAMFLRLEVMLCEVFPGATVNRIRKSDTLKDQSIAGNHAVMHRLEFLVGNDEPLDMRTPLLKLTIGATGSQGPGPVNGKPRFYIQGTGSVLEPAVRVIMPLIIKHVLKWREFWPNEPDPLKNNPGKLYTDAVRRTLFSAKEAGEDLWLFRRKTAPAHLLAAEQLCRAVKQEEPAFNDDPNDNFSYRKAWNEFLHSDRTALEFECYWYKNVKVQEQLTHIAKARAQERVQSYKKDTPMREVIRQMSMKTAQKSGALEVYLRNSDQREEIRQWVDTIEYPPLSVPVPRKTLSISPDVLAPGHVHTVPPRQEQATGEEDASSHTTSQARTCYLLFC